MLTIKEHVIRLSMPEVVRLEHVLRTIILQHAAEQLDEDGIWREESISEEEDMRKPTYIEFYSPVLRKDSIHIKNGTTCLCGEEVPEDHAVYRTTPRNELCSDCELAYMRSQAGGECHQ